MSTEYLDKTGLTYLWGKIKSKFQEKLVSGTNIKTINNQSVLGSGNIAISGGGSTVLDFYPIGSYYETSDTSFDPNVSWGGTWELITDRFLVGAGNLYAVDAEGGSKDAVVVSHHHTTNTYHRHNLVGSKYGSNYCAGGNRSGVGANDAANTTLYTNYAGSQTAASTTVGEDGTDKNMPPYKAVYIWHRTA